MIFFSRAPVVRLLSVLLVVSLFGFAAAEYNWQSDIYIRVENRFAESVAERAQLGTHGGTLFGVQEDLHDNFSKSGTEVDHYYIWFCVGSECVPVDPFEVDH